jgi:hypothetical protein
LTVRTISFAGGAASFFRLGSRISSSTTRCFSASLKTGIIDFRFFNFIRSGDCLVFDLESLSFATLISVTPLPWDTDDDLGCEELDLSFANILILVRYRLPNLSFFPSARGGGYQAVWVFVRGCLLEPDGGLRVSKNVRAVGDISTERGSSTLIETFCDRRKV